MKPDKNLLSDILGIDRVSDHLVGNGMNPWAVQPDELLIRRHIPRRGFFDQANIPIAHLNLSYTISKQDPISDTKNIQQPLSPNY